MEDALNRLLKEANAAKLAPVALAANRALELLEQPPSSNVRACEMREPLLEAVRLTLAAEPLRTSTTNAAVAILQKLVRDDRMHSKSLESDEQLWMSTQVLVALQKCQFLQEEQKQELLKVVLALSCHVGWGLNGRLAEMSVSLFASLHASGNQGTKAAAQAAVSQTIAEFCKKLNNRIVSGEGSYDELLPLFQFVVGKLAELIREDCDPQNELSLLLHTFSCLIKCSPPSLMLSSSHFAKFAKHRLVSVIVDLIDIQERTNLSKASKLASFSFRRQPRLNISVDQEKCLVRLSINLVNLMTFNGKELSGCSELLLHRLLIKAKTQTKTLALAALNELVLGDVAKVVRLMGINVERRENEEQDNNENESEENSKEEENKIKDASVNIAAFKLIGQALEECLNPKALMVEDALLCLRTLIKTLESMVEENKLDESTTKYVLKLYNNQSDADYNGPISIDWTRRLEHLVSRQEEKTEIEDENDEQEENCPVDSSDDDNEEDKNGGYNSNKDDEEREGVDDDIGGKNDDDCSNNADEEVGDSDDDQKERRDKSEGEEDNNENYDDFKDAESSDTDTEGPEEGFDHDSNHLKKYVEEAQELAEKTQQVHLFGLNSNNALMDKKEEDDDEEEARNNARLFVEHLKSELEHIRGARGSIEMDHRMQLFASNFCKEMGTMSRLREGVLLNADGVYFTSYYALHLSLYLALNNGYNEKNKPDLRELRAAFMSSVLNSGLIVYVSPIWLSEVFDMVTDVDLFHFGLKERPKVQQGLNSLLKDLDGLGATHKAAQLLNDYQRLQHDHALSKTSNHESASSLEAGRRLCRLLLSTLWPSFLKVLSSSWSSNASQSIATSLVRPNSSFEVLITVIESLKRLIMLCNSVEMHQHCSQLLEPLTTLIESKKGEQSTKNSNVGVAPRTLVVVDELLHEAIEIGAQSQDCWKYIMKLVGHVLSMESLSMSSTRPKSAESRKTEKIAKKTNESKRNNNASSLFPGEPDDLDLNFRHNDYNDDDDEIQDEHAVCKSSFAMPLDFLKQSSEVRSLRSTLPHILDETKRATQQQLNNDEWILAKDILQLKVDKLFDDAALKLNLKSLLGFLSELCFCSHKEQLRVNQHRTTIATKLRKLENKNSSKSESNNGFLFHRITEVMIKCVRSGRPLLHIVKAWAIVGGHLMETASSKACWVSKDAVSCIHDIISAFMTNTSELACFHFNESLFKPFENLVRLEACDLDTQDQIVSSLCSFVESSTSELGSGWRSLFGTLKAVRFPLEQQLALANLSLASDDDPVSNVGPMDDLESRESSVTTHWQALVDVFSAFLSTEDAQVFSNAALDFISCLVFHVRGSEERQQLEELLDSRHQEDLFSVVVNNQSASSMSRFKDITTSSLHFLMESHLILLNMAAMRECPRFEGATRVHMQPNPSVVDPVIPELDDLCIEQERNRGLSFQMLQTWGSVTKFPENNSGLFRIWYILIDGLTSAVINCPRAHQADAVETLFNMLNALLPNDNNNSEKSVQFGLYCTNHLLLPMLQNWLRRCQRTFQGWLLSGPNFKHCMGKTTDLILLWLSNEQDQLESASLLLCLKQLLLLLIECTAVPVESVARLGCSCLRHVIESGSDYFNEDQWTLICLSLCRALQTTSKPLLTLMQPFQSFSSNFYGDKDQVRVAARKDSCREELHRLAQLAQQVFILDQQRTEMPLFPDEPEKMERSFLFLIPAKNNSSSLLPKNTNDNSKSPSSSKNNKTCNESKSNESSEMAPILVSAQDPSFKRVTVRALLTGLTAHHILLQVAGATLLRRAKNILPGYENLLLQSSLKASSTSSLPRSPSTALGSAAVNKNESLNEFINEANNNEDNNEFENESKNEARNETKNTDNNAKDDESIPWLVSKLNDDQVNMLLTSFQLSYETSVQFDTRLGLKFLLQKVLSLKCAANLYKQAGTAWSLAALTLFHRCRDAFCTRRIRSIEQIKEIIDKESNKADKKEFKEERRIEHDKIKSESDKSFILAFCKLISELCEAYVELLVDKEGQQLKADNLSRRQIFFLNLTQDDFHDLTKRPESEAENEIDNEDKEEENDKSEDSEEKERLESKSSLSPKPSLSPCKSPSISEPKMSSMEDEVFQMTTDADLDAIMSEFRYSKLKRTLRSTPSNSSSNVERRSNPFQAKTNSIVQEIEPEIAAQQSSSLLADGRAQLNAFTQLVSVIFMMVKALNDDEFKLFLPLLFPSVRILTTFARDVALKKQIADWMHRVATLYGFDTSEQD